MIFAGVAALGGLPSGVVAPAPLHAKKGELPRSTSLFLLTPHRPWLFVNHEGWSRPYLSGRWI